MYPDFQNFFSMTGTTSFKNLPYHEVMHKIYANIFLVLWIFDLKFLMSDLASGVGL